MSDQTVTQDDASLRNYRPPQLVVYGAVKELTANGSLTGNENGGAGMAMNMG